MEDARDVIEQYIPVEFVGVGLLVVAGILISIGAGFAGGIWMFNLPNSLAAVWIGVGLLIVALAVYFGREIAREIRVLSQHRRNIEWKHAQAVLNESLPRPIASGPVPEKSPYPPAMPAIQTSSTNQANSDFTLALNMFAATLAAMSKEKDGERLTGKPFSYDAMQKAGYVSRWEDWSRVLDLWENAELVEEPRARSGWKILISDVGNAEQRLSSLYAHNGLVRINGIWMKS